MKLLNPLFDTVFKYLMEDIDVAKCLIEAVIKQEVLELAPAPQESTDYSIRMKYFQLGMIRQDYVAIIKTVDTHSGTASHEKVMIEVQKSPFIPEIGRFRNYLADKYRRKSVITDNGAQTESYLPIKTIYLVEDTFNPQLPAVLGRRGQYIDELESTPYLGGRDGIVELFSHDTWFIQTELLPPDFKDELMYVLSIFAPVFRTSKTDRYINVPEDSMLAEKHKILARIIRRLEAATGSSEVNTAVDLEIEYENFIERNIAETELAKQNEANALALADKERADKENALAKVEDALAKITAAVLKLHAKNMSDEDIAETLGIDIEQVRNILAGR